MKNTIYNHSPAFLKNWIASIYGHNLYRRRYNNKYYNSAFPKILERQNWNIEKLDEYQDKKIREIIGVAVRHVPYYRNLFKKLKLNQEDIRGKQDLIDALPILEKIVLKENENMFIDERAKKKSLIKYFTSGTTGSPLCIYRDKKTEGVAYAYYEARWRVPYGISKDSSWAMLGGKLIVPQERKSPPFWVWNSDRKSVA